jgi:NTP pyrophosphatase (non-canonical NTP hydrolase)
MSDYEKVLPATEGWGTVVQLGLAYRLLLNKDVRILRREIGHVWKLPSVKDDFFWIVTEVGELGDALMRLPDFPDVAPTRNQLRTTALEHVAEEAADVLIMLTCLCDELDIDLYQAFHQKLADLKAKYSPLPDAPTEQARDEADEFVATVQQAWEET